MDCHSVKQQPVHPFMPDRFAERDTREQGEENMKSYQQIKRQEDRKGSVGRVNLNVH